MKAQAHHFLAAALLLARLCAGAEESNPAGADRLPALFNVITVVPERQEMLTRSYSINHDGDGEGGWLPASVSYVGKNAKDYGTSMAITDLRLCKRPTEKKICRDFVKAIDEPPPKQGADITLTRIEGAGYATVFLTRIAPVSFEGTDASIAFLGSDSQDPPHGQLVVYLYAKEGTNLIQLARPVGECVFLQAPNESDEAYYRHHCLTNAIREKATATAANLTELFRIKR
jgi:hypothetical protein